jgi:radical SAM superfamily enzyme YgiQ (UPF0313 family)
MDSNKQKTEILLVGINARFSHTAIALRYLLVNMGSLQKSTIMIEHNISDRAIDIVEKVLDYKSTIVAFSVYIWNTTLVSEVATLLKLTSPETILIAGGPEVSFANNNHPVVNVVDNVISGEGEDSFPSLCKDILSGNSPEEKFISSSLPDLNKIALPYGLYSDSDIKNRVIYLETSRGCPFSCEFCISSLDRKVRKFPFDKIMAQIEILWNRGVRHFKFLDRDITLGYPIELLKFFLERKTPEILLHFELVPGRLSLEFWNLILEFPPGTIQLEIGVQTLNETVATRIKRRQKNSKILKEIERFQKESLCHIHGDLIAGLPGEDMDSFAKGFNLLKSTGVQEIQLGILKKLWGTPISRHTEEFSMVYNHLPPYEVLSTSSVSFKEMMEIKRFARYWDLISNSGNFKNTVALFWENKTPFQGFMEFSLWLYRTTGKTHTFSLNRLAQLIYTWLTEVENFEKEIVVGSILDDYKRVGRTSIPAFMQLSKKQNSSKLNSSNYAGRQKRHQPNNE